MDELTPQLPQQSVAPTTTEQEDIVTAGQRRINLIWEVTQAAIAIIVVISNMTVAMYQALVPIPVDTVRPEFPIILSSSLFLIVGFYFSRTNHQAIGGMGKKPIMPQYQGR